MPVRVELIFEGDDPISVLRNFLDNDWPRLRSMSARGYGEYANTTLTMSTTDQTSKSWIVPLTEGEE